MAFPKGLEVHIMLVILIVGIGRVSTARSLNEEDQPTIVVRVDNLAGVPADIVQFAENRAAAIFGRIGARIRWIDQETAIREGIRARFSVVLVNAQNSVGRASVFVEALGLADPTVRRAHVFYDRAAALNVRATRTIPSLLGDVMAHELGHLLLSPPGHSSDGIMRPGVEVKLWALETFTKSQALEVMSRLRQLP
jgi:hypothetical protein